MPIIKFNDGTKVNVQGNPTDADIIEIAKQLGVDKRMQSMGVQGDSTGVGDQGQGMSQPSAPQNFQMPPAPQRSAPGVFSSNVGQDSGLTSALKTAANIPFDAAAAAYNFGAGAVKGLAGIPDIFSGAKDYYNETKGLPIGQRVGQVLGGLGETAYQSFVPPAARDIVNAGVNSVGLNNVLPEGVKQTIAPKTTDEALASAQENIVGNPVQNILPFIMLGRSAATRAGLGAEFDGAISTLAKPVTKPMNYAAGKGLDFLSFTSDQPRAAFDTMLNNRNQYLQQLKSNPTQETVYSTAVGAVKAARTRATAGYQAGLEQISKEYNGVRTGLPDNLEAQYQKFANEYSFENVPQNIKNVSALEASKVLNDVNDALNRLQEGTPDYAKISILKNSLKNRFVDAFGGKDGSFNRLFTNYSSITRVVDIADDLIKSRVDNPKTVTTAQKALLDVFNENKPAYLNAIINLEKMTGKPILEQVAAQKLGKRMPEIGKVNSVFDSGVALVKLLAAPLVTSPRMASFIARSFKGLNEVPNTSTGTKGVLINTANNLNNNDK